MRTVKRRTKQRAAEAKKAEKAANAPPKAVSTKKAANELDNSDLNPNVWRHLSLPQFCAKMSLENHKTNQNNSNTSRSAADKSRSSERLRNQIPTPTSSWSTLVSPNSSRHILGSRLERPRRMCPFELGLGY